MNETLLRKIYRAIRESDLANLKQLVAENQNEVCSKGLLQETVAEAVSYGGDLPTIDFLIENGADINAIAPGGDAIVTALSENRLPLIPELINRGARFNTSRLGSNPLILAIGANNADAVRLLLSSGIDAHKIYTLDGGGLRNAIEYADSRGQVEIVQILRDAGCRMPEQVDSDDIVKQSRSIILDAITKRFGDPTIELYDRFQLRDTEWNVEIFVAHPTNEYPFHTFFTVGMSIRWYRLSVDPAEDMFLELMIQLPFTWDPKSKDFRNAEFQWPLTWFKAIANGLHEEDIILRDKIAIISNGDPAESLGKGTNQSCILLLPDFYDFSPVDLGYTRQVHYYHLVPLYSEERDFEKKNGTLPLLERMANTPGALIVRPTRERFV